MEGERLEEKKEGVCVMEAETKWRQEKMDK